MLKNFSPFFLFSILMFGLACQERVSDRSKSEISRTNFNAEWQQIDSLEKAGAGKSIIKKCNSILIDAKSVGNYEAIFKSLSIRSKYIQQIEEESSYRIIKDFESELEASEPPLRNILNSALAELYLQYFQQNRWRFQGRTPTSDLQQDFRSFSLEELLNKAKAHYILSMEEAEKLQKIPLKDLSKIVLWENQSLNQSTEINESLSLYNLLSTRALRFFQNPPQVDLELIKESSFSDLQLLGSSLEFLSIPSQFTINSSYSELIIYLIQQDIKLLEKEEEDKRISADLKRLEYFYQEATISEKDSLYLKRLLFYYDNYPKAKQAKYFLAQLYHQWGSRGTVTNKFNYLVKAHAVLSEIPGEDKSHFAKLARLLKAQIELKSLNFQCESTYPTGVEPEIFITYRNLESVNIQVYKLLEKDFEELNSLRNHEEKLSLISGFKKINESEVKLSTPYKFEQHQKEIKLQSLEIGRYVILISSDKNPLANQSGTAFQLIQISDLSYLYRKSERKNGLEIFTLNRISGLPEGNVEIEIQEINRDGLNENSTQKLISSKTGYAFYPLPEKWKNFQIQLSKDGDKLLPFNYNSYRHSKGTESRKSLKLFADRAIYRPGQTVYFKGIVYRGIKDLKVDSSYSDVLRFLDVNRKEIKRLEVKSNSFGSFEGSLQIPSSGLSGSYSLSSGIGSINIQVESYKRPSFQIELDTIHGSYRIGDSIKVSGKLKAYAGQYLSNSKVEFHITRKVHFPIAYHFYFPMYSEEKEIASGRVVSNSKGEFVFTFLAKKERDVPEDQDPLLNYTIEVSGTSLSGETRSSSQHILINKKGYQMHSNLDSESNLSSVQALEVNCQNNSGLDISVQGKLQLFLLERPHNFKIPKLWNQAQVRFSKHFSSASPTTIGLDSLRKKKLISESNIACNETLNLFKDLQPGPYLLVFKGKDLEGNSYQHEERFVLFNEASSKLAMPEFHFFKALNTEASPGDSAAFVIGTSLKNLALLYEVEQDGRVIHREKIRLEQEQKKISFPIDYNHQGDVFIRLSGIHSNRVINYLQRIEVPHVEKELTVHLSSFKDKTEPGSKEQWKLSILNHKDSPEPIELLASMYDLSLDQFFKQDWVFDPHPKRAHASPWNFGQINQNRYSHFYGPQFNPKLIQPNYPPIPQLNWFGFHLYTNHYRQFNMASDMAMPMAVAANTSGEVSEKTTETIEEQETKSSNQSLEIPSIRSDLRETVFFYPQLKSNSEGSVSLEFQMPDALTSWKFRAIAHSKDLKIGQVEQVITSQKELMLFPNTPRFFRASDTLVYSCLLSNLGEEDKVGELNLTFRDRETKQVIDLSLESGNKKKFTLKAKESKEFSWTLFIPEGIQHLTYLLEASSISHRDAEQGYIPILPKRIILTESFPIATRAGETKDYTFKNLLASSASSSLKHKNLVLEYTSNPAWLAIQTLPFIARDNNESSEQYFARYFANRLALKIIEKNPSIVEVFHQNMSSKEYFKSSLSKNENIKSARIEDSPFLNQALSEEERNKALAKFFNPNQINYELQENLDYLIQLQLENGAWSWFKGMRENRYISQYILAGFGRLQQMQIDKLPYESIEKGLKYIDKQMERDYQQLKEINGLDQYTISPIHVHYLYTRSFFNAIPGPENKDFFQFFLKKLIEQWPKQNIGVKSMSALVFHRYKRKSEEAQKVLKSLEEFAILSDELGMYWKMNKTHFWHESEISAQSLAIEAFHELGGNPVMLEELKYYLLKLKETQSWPNSKSSTEAVYALLEKGENLSQSSGNSIIQVGPDIINSKEESKMAGSGYFNRFWTSTDIKPAQGKIKVINQSNRASWGAIHWQFEEDIDQVKHSDDNSLRVEKRIYRKVQTSAGPKLVLLSQSPINVGDELVVRIKIINNRDLEFVHLRDGRASGLEPVYSNSGLKFQDGISYYQDANDYFTNFYFERLNRGVYELEYSLRANNAGNFKSGVSSIQSMYAPGFSSHSQSQNIEILAQ